MFIKYTFLKKYYKNNFYNLFLNILFKKILQKQYL